MPSAPTYTDVEGAENCDCDHVRMGTGLRLQLCKVTLPVQ